MELRPYTESDLIGRLSRIRVPAAVTTSLAAGQKPSLPGEIARVAWDDNVFLFLVSSVSQSEVSGWFTDIAGGVAVPDLGRQDVSLGSALRVDGPIESLPAVAVDATVGALNSSPSSSVAEKLAGFESGSQATTGQRPEQSVADLLATFEQLRGGDGTIPSLLSAHGFTLIRLKNMLGVESRTAFALLRGDEALTPEQEAQLSRVAGIGAAELASVRPKLPSELIDVLWEHTFRAATTAAAKRVDGAESAGWNRIARGAAALAPRTTTAASAPINWRDRVERFIEAAGL